MRHNILFNRGFNRGVSAISSARYRGDPGAPPRTNRRGWTAGMAAVLVLAMLVVSSCRSGGVATSEDRAPAGVGAAGMAVAAQEAGAGRQGKTDESAGADKQQEAGKKPELEFVGSLAGHTQPVTCFDFSPDGKWIASGSEDGTVRVWDVATGSMVKTLSLDEQVARCIGFSPDGSMLACGGGDSENTNRGLHVWSCSSWARFPQLEAKGAVVSLSWSPDSVAIAVETRTWSGRWANEKFERKERNIALVAVAVSGVWARTVRVKEDTFYGKEASEYGRSDYWPELSPWYSPIGNAIVFNYYQYQEVEDAHTGQELDLPHRIPTLFDVSRRGRHAVIHREKESVIVDYVALLKGTFVELAKLGDHKFIGFVDDERVLLGKDGRLHRLTLGGTGEILPISEVEFPDWEDSKARIVDNTIAIQMHRGNELILYDAASATELRRIGGHWGSARCVAARSHRPQIASGGSDGSVCLWDTDKACYVRSMSGGGTVEVEGEEVRLPNRHSEQVNIVTFSPDGKLLASGSNDRRVILWNPDTGDAIRELKGHHHNVTSLSFSPDGMLIASGSDDCTVRIWEASTGKLLDLIKPMEGAVASVQFDKSGETLLVAGASASPHSNSDGRIELYRVAVSGRAAFAGGMNHEDPVRAAFDSATGVVSLPPGTSAEAECIIIDEHGRRVTLRQEGLYLKEDFEWFDHRDSQFGDMRFSIIHGVPFARELRDDRYVEAIWAFERIAANADQSVIALAGDPENPLKPIQLWRLKK